MLLGFIFVLLGVFCWFLFVCVVGVVVVVGQGLHIGYVVGVE